MLMMLLTFRKYVALYPDQIKKPNCESADEFINEFLQKGEEIIAVTVKNQPLRHYSLQPHINRVYHIRKA